MRLFPELSEAKWVGHPIRIWVMTYKPLFVARMNRPHSFSNLGFRFRHA
jgi:hypothetical protein